MPDAPTAPPRLFEGLCEVTTDAARREADLGGAEPDGVPARFVFDLEEVVGVNEKLADDGATIAPDRCSVDYSTGSCFLLLTPYETLRAAWIAYRTHADALTRIRN